jgi:hypothetical protein
MAVITPIDKADEKNEFGRHGKGQDEP